jgi:hypothetical protein
VKKHREFDGLIKSVTVSKAPSGKYTAVVWQWEQARY